MSEEKSFVKDPSVLEESHRIEDLFDTDPIADKLMQKLINAPANSIHGLIGEYGTGKSTLLNKISKKIPHDLWIEFDAWKFPERKELWEGFVLEFARQIDEESFNEVRKNIDGEQNNDKKTLVNTLGDIPIPGFAAIKNLAHFYETSPARRTFEIQDILKNLLDKKAAKQTIYIVVEDIDRSGDAGIFFLETLRYFLRSLETKSIIKVIVPIANSKYYENSDSYVKCLDTVDFYSLADVKMGRFVDAVFANDLAGVALIKKQLVEFFELLIVVPEITPRKLKLILRKADLNYLSMQKDGHEPDARTSILFEVSKYLPLKTDSQQTLFEGYRQTREMGGSSALIPAFASAIATGHPLLDYEKKLIRNRQNFKLIPRQGTVEQFPSTPYTINRPSRDGHYSYCCDFYLDY